MHPCEIGMRRARSTTKTFSAPPRRSGINIFDAVNAVARPQIRSLVEQWLSPTRVSGENLIAKNPTRADKSLGSFTIHMRTGLWADFATGDTGGDIISFYAYINGLPQLAAAKELAEKLGVRT